MARRRPDGSIFYAPNREPSVDLDTKILHVSGLENLVLPKHHGWSGSGPGGSFQPPDIRNAYVPHSELTGEGQSVGLFEFDGYYTAVIEKYQQQFNINVPVNTVLNDGFVATSSQSGPPLCGCSPTLACVVQSVNPINPPPPAGTPGTGQDEVTLDIYMAMTMAPGLSAIYVYEGCNADDILAAMAELNSDGFLPFQLSSSWSWFPTDESQLQSLTLMGVQGQTFLMAAGDDHATCPVGQGNTTLALPNVTIVGGTILEMKDHGMSRLPETAATDGGGVLIGVPQPYYQGVFGSIAGGSTQWRMIPDVSMVSCDGGPCGMFGYQQSSAGVSPSCCAVGTSAATPLWAGFVAMINEKRRTRGKCTGMGFLNPALYAIAASDTIYHQNFHDITKGSSPAAPAPNCTAGVATSAAPGFDLVTGLGTPKPHLIDELAPPPPPNTATCPCDLFWCPRLSVCTNAMICGYDLPPSPTTPGN
jgi:kumamolisin